jgi:hypothetical protein
MTIFYDGKLWTERLSFVGRHPDGRRFYLYSSVALAFAVFARRLADKPKWKRVATVEERAYAGELHRVDGCFVPMGRDATPEEHANNKAIWWREVVHFEALVVPLTATPNPRSK